MSFSDQSTNTVYLSESLNKKYPKIFTEMVSFFCTNNIKWGLIATNNIWTRDYMPIQVEDHYVKFGYKGYGEGYKKFPWLKVSSKAYDFLGEIKYSSIILDGGNIQRCDGIAFITDIIFKHNPNIEKTKLIGQLEKLLQVKIIFLPVEPGDDLGHSDGILTPVCSGPLDQCMVLVNDYSSMKQKQYNKYQDSILKILNKNNIDHALMPYAFNQCLHLSDKDFYKKFPLADDNNPAVGYYINFLVVKNCVLLPVFGFKKDIEAISIVEKYFPDHKIKTINCSELAMEGGLTHCISMNYKI